MAMASRGQSVEDLRFRQHPTRVPEEELEQAELGGGQLDRGAAASAEMGVDVEFDAQRVERAL